MSVTRRKANNPWVVLFACTVIQFTADGSLRSFGLFYVEILDEFEASVSLTTLVSGVMLGVFCLASLPVMLILVTKITPRGTLILGSVLLSAGYSISCLAPDIYFLLFSISIVVGIGLACTFSPSIYVLGRYFPNRRSTVNGIAISGGSLAALVFPSLYHYFIEKFGLRGGLLLSGGILLHNLPMSLFLRLPEGIHDDFHDISSDSVEQKTDEDDLFNDNMQEPSTVACLPRYINQEKELQFHNSLPSISTNSKYSMKNEILSNNVQTYSDHCIYTKLKMKETRRRGLGHLNVHSTHNIYSLVDVETNSSSTTSEGSNTSNESIFDLMKNSCFILFLFANSFSTIVSSTYLPFLPLFARSNNIEDDEIVIFISLSGAMDLIGRCLCGLLADRSWLSSYNILAFSQLVCGTLYNCNHFVTSFPVFIIFCVLIGFFSCMNLTLIHTIMIDLCGIQNYPTALAATTVSQLPLFVLGPFIFGLLRDLTGDFAASYHVTGTMALISALLFLLIPFMKNCFLDQSTNIEIRKA